MTSLSSQLRSFLNGVVGNDNYYEFVILRSVGQQNSASATTRVSSFDSDLQASVFHELLNRLGRKGVVKQYKEYVVGDVHYLNSDNKDVKVTQKTYYQSHDFMGTFLCLSGSKKKLNILSYPSVFDSDYEAFHKVYQVRINNRIHVRFIQGRCVNATNKYYNIVVSYTHEDSVEKKHNIDELVKVISTLTQQVSIS